VPTERKKCRDTPLFASRQNDQFNQSNVTEQIAVKIDRPRWKGDERQKIS
jgi:hypothetical protein